MSVRRAAGFVVAAVVLVASVVVAIAVGSTESMTVGDAATGLLTRVTGLSADPDLRYLQTVVWELRLPRVALAALSGAALALAGVVMQGLLRNPMVSPFTLGISPAAAFGAALAIMFGAASGRGDPLIVASALVVGMGCAGLALGLSAVRRTSATSLILVGMALTYLFSAATASLQYVATTEQLAEIVRWTFGSVNGATWYHSAVVGATLLVVMPLLWARSGALDAVAFAGDDVARSLGIEVSRLRLVGSFLAVLLTAVVVSYTGVIGFVGLVGPHIARLLVGGEHRVLVPFACVTGATLVVVADTIGRTVLSPAVIPVGIVVSFVGAPLFLNLVLTRRRLFL